MHGVGDKEKLLIIGIRIILYHLGIGVFAEIAGMSFFAVYHEDGTADFIAVSQNRHIEIGLITGHIPAQSLTLGTRVKSSFSAAVIGNIILYKLGSISRRNIRPCAGCGVETVFIIFCPLQTHGFAFFITGFFVVFFIKIAVGKNTGHVIHGGSKRGFNADIQCRGIESHTAESANADDPDLF